MRAVCFTFLALASLASAYDLTLRDGSVLKDIRLRSKTDLGITVQHSTGQKFVDYAQLPVPDLYTWGFDEQRYWSAQGSSTPPVLPPKPEATEPADTGRPARLYRSLSPDVSSEPEADNTMGTSRDYSPHTDSVSSTIRGQCTGRTKKGYRCSRMAQAGSSTCYQH